MSAEPFSADDELAELYEDLDAADLQPLWNITSTLLTPTPRPRAVPWLWPAATMRPLAERAIRLVPIERGGERRVLSLSNPGLGGQPYAAGTLWGAIQCLGPRETAPAHRHSPGAIRFVLEGSGVWTTVDGDACDMAPGDLILTPANTWHDHTNAGDGKMFWFDGLDLPMIEALDAVFFEPYPDDQQQAPDDHNRSLAEHGDAGPVTAEGKVSDALDPRPSPLLVYGWKETDERLSDMLASTTGSFAQLEFVNPYTGASVLPTLACRMLRMGAGGGVPGMRRTGNAIHVVFRGRGSSVIDGIRFDWEPGDMFVVPSWCAAEHRSAAGADLFVCSDEPVTRALGIYREEQLTAPQPIVSHFAPRDTVEGGRRS